MPDTPTTIRKSNHKTIQIPIPSPNLTPQYYVEWLTLIYGSPQNLDVWLQQNPLLMFWRMQEE